MESGTMSLRDKGQGEASAGAAVEKVAEAYMGGGRGLESWRWQDLGKQSCRASRGVRGCECTSKAGRGEKRWVRDAR